MNSAGRYEGVEGQITALYFNLTLPTASVLLCLTSILALPITRCMFLSAAVVSLFACGLHWRVAPRYETLVATGYGYALVTLAFFWAIFEYFVPVRGDALQLLGLCIFVPLTINSWGFVFFGFPRQRLILSWLLSIGTFFILERAVLRDRVFNPALFFLLFANCVVIQRTSLILKLNNKYIINEQEISTDALTGLLNRHAFKKIEGERSFFIYLIVLDIDHFKRINDKYGHPAGDRVLRAVGDILLDKLNGRGQAFRWGGEEFVLLLPVLAFADVNDWLNAVRAEIASRTFVDGQHITVSMGVSLSSGTLSIWEAFAQADKALLEAKNGGRDQVRWFQTVVSPPLA